MYPSKALLHVAKVIEEAKALASAASFSVNRRPTSTSCALEEKEVITQLTGGLAGMAKMRKVEVVNGLGRFTGPNTLEVEGADGKTTVTFDNAIIAARFPSGEAARSSPMTDPRVWDSTDALELTTRT